MHKKLIKEIIAGKSQASMQELECITIQMLDELKEKDYEAYKHLEFKLYKLVYGEHLNEDLATEWVHHMENKDGTHGEHWNKFQTDQYAGEFNKWDWYAALNMVYSDYYNPKYDTNNYIELAKDFINDKDIGEGKVFRYYFYIVCK